MNHFTFHGLIRNRFNDFNIFEKERSLRPKALSFGSTAIGRGGRGDSERVI